MKQRITGSQQAALTAVPFSTHCLSPLKQAKSSAHTNGQK
jgi:hypothetical protein